MNSIPGFVPGYVYSRPRIQEVFAQRIAAGNWVMGSQQTGLAGTWQRMKAAGVTRVSLRDAEIPLLGRHRRPYFQRKGTCVSRGVARALQVSLDYAIARLGALLIPVEVAFAPIYSMARHEIGRDRCGYGDGAMLCDAIQAIHSMGIATTDLFKGLAEVQQELLAVKYATPGVGTPQAWKEACAGHTAISFSPDNLELLFDCIAAGYAAPYACGWVTADRPGSNGIYRLGDAGCHCRCFVGLVIDENGNTQLESNESWSAFPADQPNEKYSTCDVNDIPCCKFKTASEMITLAPGDCIVDAKQFWQACQSSGEIWAVGAAEYAGDTIADLTKKAVAA